MSSTHQTPEQNGAISSENKPQVVVRAGKYYVCSSCGTMVEIPADVVGQLVVMVEPAPQADTTEEKSSTPAKVASDVSEQHANSLARPASRTYQSSGGRAQSPSTRSLPQSSRPPRPRRPRKPNRDSFLGTIIDGLRVPSAQEMDRALAWVSFHLNVLDRQGSELKRLQKLLKEQSVSCPGPRRHAHEDVSQEPVVPATGAPQSHAHADVSMAPALRPECSDQTQERGPPD